MRNRPFDWWLTGWLTGWFVAGLHMELMHDGDPHLTRIAWVIMIVCLAGLYVMRWLGARR